jgi:acetyl esterase/lipase
MLVGDRDTVALVRFSEEYAEALRRRGAMVRLTVVPGLEHDMFLEPVVFEELSRLVKDGSARRP